MFQPKISPLFGFVFLIIQVFSEHSAPEPNYQYQYQINEPHSQLEFGHEEERVGNTAEGKYHVLLPDGRTQKVNYTADETGYNVDIYYDKTLYDHRQNYGSGYLYSHGSHSPIGSQQTPSNQNGHPFKSSQEYNVKTTTAKKVSPSNKNPASFPSFPPHYLTSYGVGGFEDGARVDHGQAPQNGFYQKQINRPGISSQGAKNSQRPIKPIHQVRLSGHNEQDYADRNSQKYAFQHAPENYGYTPILKTDNSRSPVSKTWASSDKYSGFKDHRPQESVVNQLRESSKSSVSNTAGKSKLAEEKKTVSDKYHGTGNKTNTWEKASNEWSSDQYPSRILPQQPNSEHLLHGQQDIWRQKYSDEHSGKHLQYPMVTPTPDVGSYRPGNSQNGKSYMNNEHMCLCPCQGA